jgi:type VI secretion system protein ImpC
VEYEVSFGQISKPARAAVGPTFRLAVLGDFSAGASAGRSDAGKPLASRKPLRVDFDSFESVMERLDISLAISLDETEGTSTIQIRSLDDFHPDQLVESLPIFEQLLQLRRNLQNRASFQRAAKEVLSWSDETPLLPSHHRRSRGVAIATDRRLSDFARLTGRAAEKEADTDSLIRRLVGPYIQKSADPRQDALIARVDAAIAAVMRRILHHADFQALESLWRGIDLLVRRVDTGTKMQIVLYDVSAEELAADIASTNELTSSALYRMLVEQPLLDADQGPLSMIIGLYQFEAVPPHADLLGRIAKIVAAAGAPFFAGVGQDLLQVPLRDWHPLSRQAWDALRALPEAAYLGLATPRFLLRLPYGKKTDPIDAFAFEEFTRQEGLSGMLWGHPGLLVANLTAETWRRSSDKMQLGTVATVADLPVFVYTDDDGDQIALPCTERLFSERQADHIIGTGVNPIVSLRGRPEVRIGGFKAVAGNVLAGRWAPIDLASAQAVAHDASNTQPEELITTVTPAIPQDQDTEADSSELDALLNDLSGVTSDPPAADTASETAISTEAAAITEPEEVIAETMAEQPADDLDALLASLNPEPAAADESATEPDLDALLASLK